MHNKSGMPIPRERLAVQLYTVRDFMSNPADLAETLAKVARIGYGGVQLSAVRAMDGENPAVNAETAHRMLEDNGLACAATHRSWDALRDRTDDEIAFHHTLGCDYAAIGGLPAQYQSQGADGYRRFLADARPVIERLKQGGIRFGYHNHDFEFERIPDASPDGPRTMYDIFVEEGGPDLHLEIDVYWVWHAGGDAASLLARSAHRLPLIHLKDKEVVSGKGPIMAAIGEGNLPWDRILPAAESAGTGWYAVEQDVCPRDPFDCLRSSFEYLTCK